MNFSLLHWLFWHHIGKARRWNEHSQTALFIHSRCGGPQGCLVNPHSLRMLVVLQRGPSGEGWEGLLSGSVPLEYRCSEDPGLGWWQRARRCSLPHNPMHRIFTPCVQLMSLEHRLCAILLPRQKFLLTRSLLHEEIKSDSGANPWFCT